MSGNDRRRVWIYVVGVLGAVALGVIGVFTVSHTVGGSSNSCVGSVCGDGNQNSFVNPASSSPGPAVTP